MKLEDLLLLAKKHGVQTISATTEDAGAVSVTLHAVEDLDFPKQAFIEDPDEREQLKGPPPRIGRDGLTAEQQEELYMARMSDTKG